MLVGKEVEQARSKKATSFGNLGQNYSLNESVVSNGFGSDHRE